MKATRVLPLLAFLASLCAARSAAADKREGEDPEHRSAFELARFGVHGGWFSGTQQVGYGSVQGYDGGLGVMDLDVIRYPSENVGFQFSLGYGGAKQSYGTGGGYHYFRLATAVDFGILSWSGPGKSGLSVGAGMGGDFGQNRYWFAEKGVAYPLLLSSLRIWATRQVSLHASYQWLPTSTGSMPIHAHRFEAAVGVGYLQVGARLELVSMRGGDPIRTFFDRETSLFVGFALY